MNPSPRLQAALEAFAERNNPVGEVHYSVCGCCGQIEWVSTRASADRKVVGEISDGRCGRCAEVYQRNPELVKWVMSVFSFQEMQAINKGQAETQR